MMLVVSAPGRARAGTVEVSLLDRDIRYTLFTVEREQTEFFHLNKVAELFQLPVEIDPIGGRVILQADGQAASFFPGQPTVIVDRRSYALSSPPIRMEGVIMLPLEFLTTILPILSGKDVQWDASERKLRIGAQRLTMTALYASPYGDFTRLTVDLSEPVTPEVREKLPSLLIFELPQAELLLPDNPLEVNSRSVKHVKVVDTFGTTQIVIRLEKEFVRYTHEVTDHPPRLVIDVYNTQETLVDAPTSPDIQEEDITIEDGTAAPAMAAPLQLRTIVIDPGHGGSDAGVVVNPAAADVPEIVEKQVTFAIAAQLRTLLSERLGARVVVTREGDDFISPENRATIANNNRADIFISIHINNSLAAGMHGFEAYIMDYGSLDVPAETGEISAQSQVLDFAQAKYLAQSEQLAKELVAAYAARREGARAVVKRAPLFTLKGTTMPAVHLEIGYCSNDQERQLLTQPDFQQTLVAALADGIAAFKKARETAP